MQYAFAYAGIPRSIFLDVDRQRSKITGDNCQFIARPLSGEIGVYSAADAEYYLKKFGELLLRESGAAAQEAAFALIYIETSSGQAAEFASDFFPAVFTLPIQWELDESTNHRMANSKNQLIELLRSETARIKKVFPPLKKIVSESSNTTPLLLPPRNFSSKTYIDGLRNLQQRLRIGDDVFEEVKDFCVSHERRHPRQAIAGSSRRCYVDDRSVEFHPPGSARHAFARPHLDHPPYCFVAGRRRLGVPYDRAFHYDCARGIRPLSVDLYGCHQASSRQTGDPHINIAPNDFVRL